MEMPQASHFQLQVSRCSLNASLLSKVDLHLTQLTNFVLTEEAVVEVDEVEDVPLFELFVLLLLNKELEVPFDFTVATFDDVLFGSCLFTMLKSASPSGAGMYSRIFSCCRAT